MSSRPSTSRRSSLSSVVILGVTLFAAPALGAQSTSSGAGGAQAAPAAQAATTSPACSAPEHRQFDFWLGEWEVTANGRPAGTNRIERALGGCALVEHWTGAKSSRGTSINAYDAATRRWYQTWVDNGGLVLRLEGEYRDGRMVLEGTAPTQNGKSARQRITWTPLDGGRVRQLWETSEDGAAWAVVFDGIYAPARR